MSFACVGGKFSKLVDVCVTRILTFMRSLVLSYSCTTDCSDNDIDDTLMSSLIRCSNAGEFSNVNLKNKSYEIHTYA